MSTPAERVLGIDPGLNTTGYAVIERAAGKLKLVEAGVVRGKSRGDLSARLKEVFDGVMQAAKEIDFDPTKEQDLDWAWKHYFELILKNVEDKFGVKLGE